ncbi:MAG: LysR family transcriptional regulator [Bacteroidales bacterium]|jgi:LysR family cyn operon transcriptional activator|nr:LysR family transcriptional regulator [Bacteroidales bacterium]
MELRQLRYFCTVAAYKNFSNAAHELNITQSTLSQQIKQLEQELNVELLNRDSRHVRLTDTGLAFLPQARKTIVEADSCIDKIRDVQKLGTGTLNIGSTYTFSPILKEVVLDFMKAYPGVKLNLFCHSMEKLMEMLDDQEIDVALSYKPYENYPNIESHIIFDNSLVCVASKKNKLSEQKLIRLSELEKWKLALPAKGLQARNTFDRMVEGLDYRFDVRLEINEINVLLDLIRETTLVTVLSQATIAGQQDLCAIKLDQSGTSMEGSFHIKKNAYMKSATKTFIKMLYDNRTYSMALMDLF